MIKETVLGWIGKIPYAHYITNKYILSLLILAGMVVLAKLVLFIFEKVLERIAKKTKTELDDMVFERTKKPLFYLILAYGVKLAVLNLNINGWLTKTINSLMALVFVFILVRAVDVIIEFWGKTFAQKTKTRLDDVLLPLFRKTINVVFVIIAFMWILKIWGIDITPYLAGVGIGGLVLGLALQDSLKNILGGISLILDKTFHAGDKIKLESGELGEVLDIGLRSTKLKTYDGELIYVPNGYLANSRIQNFNRPNARVRVNVEFGVVYGSKVKEVQKTVLGAVKSIAGVLDEPIPSVDFLEMGDFALKFKVYFWVDDWREAYNKKKEATEKIYDALNKAKISIPFPTQMIYLKK